MLDGVGGGGGKAKLKIPLKKHSSMYNCVLHTFSFYYKSINLKTPEFSHILHPYKKYQVSWTLFPEQSHPSTQFSHCLEPGTWQNINTTNLQDRYTEITISSKPTLPQTLTFNAEKKKKKPKKQEKWLTSNIMYPHPLRENTTAKHPFTGRTKNWQWQENNQKQGNTITNIHTKKRMEHIHKSSFPGGL